MLQSRTKLVCLGRVCTPPLCAAAVCRIAGAVIVFFGAITVRVDSHSRALWREALPGHDQTGPPAVVSAGTSLRMRLDAMRRTSLGCHVDACLDPGDSNTRHCSTECLFGRTGGAVSAGGAWNQPIRFVLSTLAQPLGLGGTVCGGTADRCGRARFL